MGWIIYPQNSCIEILTSVAQNVTYFEIESLQRESSWNEVDKMVPNPVWLVSL